MPINYIKKTMITILLYLKYNSFLNTVHYIIFLCRTQRIPKSFIILLTIAQARARTDI